MEKGASMEVSSLIRTIIISLYLPSFSQTMPDE